MKPSEIGGQAVLEGVMMKNQETYAVAVRKPDKQIVVEKKEFHGVAEKYPFLGWLFIRGVVNFVESMILGMRTLTFSASFYEEEDQTEPSQFEKKLISIMGEKAEAVMMGCTVVLSILLAVAIFMLLPFWIASLLEKVVTSSAVLTLVEGVIRITIFVGYVLAISTMKDIRRVFMYHGAEHKSINCIEQELPLTVENVKKQSTRHKRCGTSFMLFVIILSALFFMFIRVDNMWLRMVFRILLIPVIAGVSYELIKLAGRSESQVVAILSKPGLWLQGLTTREPDEEMIEVAIRSVEAVFDWRAFLAGELLSAEAEKKKAKAAKKKQKKTAEKAIEEKAVLEKEKLESTENIKKTVKEESEPEEKREYIDKKEKNVLIEEGEEIRETEQTQEIEEKGTEKTQEIKEAKKTEEAQETREAKGIEKTQETKKEGKEIEAERKQTKVQPTETKKTGWKQETAELQAVKKEIAVAKEDSEPKALAENSTTPRKPVSRPTGAGAGNVTAVNRAKTSMAVAGANRAEAAGSAEASAVKKLVSRPAAAGRTATGAAESKGTEPGKPVAARRPTTGTRQAGIRPEKTTAQSAAGEPTETRKPAAKPTTTEPTARASAVARPAATQTEKAPVARPVKRQVKKEEEISREQIEEKKENLVKRARPEPTIKRNATTKPSMMKQIEEEEDDEILNALDRFFVYKKQENQEDTKANHQGRKDRAGAGGV
ncbi:MAG: DUF1385 domain-containing protein [Lachnospiraceae bacterium]|nr:DUF1385 domain-containing protein [Lachnospiraceae bacterium]